MVHIFILLVSVFDQSIKIHEVLTSILVVEVTTERNVDVLCSEVISNIGHLSCEVEQTFWQVIGLEPLIIYDSWLCPPVIKVEALEAPVHIVGDMSKDVISVTSIVRERSPQEFQCLILSPILLVSVVYTTHHQSIKAHPIEQGSLSAGVAEGINLPNHVRSIVKLFLEEVMTPLHVGNHILIVCRSLIIHRPAATHELQLFCFEETLHISFHGLILF